MITTSYVGAGFKELITGLVKIYDPQTIVELGTQQGASAILIAKAMGKGHLYTYDTFKENYPQPPFAKTKADLNATKKNITAHQLEDKITIHQKDAFLAYEDFKNVDLLHIDLCNYYDNVYQVLLKWHKKVNKLILLEGGILNKWQQKLGFRPFNEVLDLSIIKNNYNKVTIQKDNMYAITMLVRK